MAGGQALSSVGGFMAAGKEKEAAAKRYKRELAIRRIKWDGQRALYGTRVAEYETEVQENFLKASTAYGNEQARLNSLFEEAPLVLKRTLPTLWRILSLAVLAKLVKDLKQGTLPSLAGIKH